MMLHWIKYYFLKNCSRQEILALLSRNHGINISRSTLKRNLLLLGLTRRNIIESPIEDICNAIIKELDSSGYNLGYRTLWQKLVHSWNLKVKRSTVYFILRIVDPEGVADRLARRLKRREYKSPGPNFIWHLDGYDKLKQFGFPIHGCVCGFSRKVTWLKVGDTNNDPKVTAHYFLQTEKRKGIVPTIIRSDGGKENVLIQSLQIALRQKHSDKLAGPNSFITGKSVHNQRIESFWGQLRKHSMDFYIQLFKCLQERNLFNGSEFHIECLRYFFGSLIEYDLKEFMSLWDKHQVRKQSGKNIIHGKPFILYNLPEKFSAKNYQKDVDLSGVERLLRSNFVKKPKLNDPKFIDEIQNCFPGITRPLEIQEALDLYKSLITM